MDVVDPHAAHAAHGAGEAPVDELGCQTDRLEYLGGMVALHGGDAHLGHDGHDARGGRAVEPPDALGGAQLDPVCRCEVVLGGKGGNVGMGAVGPDAARRVTHQCREIMGGKRVAGFNDQVRERAKPRPHQMIVDRSHREQGGDGDLSRPCAIGERHDVRPRANRRLNLAAKGDEGLVERIGTGIASINGAECARVEPRVLD